MLGMQYQSRQSVATNQEVPNTNMDLNNPNDVSEIRLDLPTEQDPYEGRNL